MNLFLLYFLAVKVWSFNVESFSRRLEIIDELNYRGWPESVPPSANCWQSNMVIFEFMTFDILRVYFKGVVFSFLYLWAQEMYASIDRGFCMIFQVEMISMRLHFLMKHWNCGSLQMSSHSQNNIRAKAPHRGERTKPKTQNFQHSNSSTWELA